MFASAVRAIQRLPVQGNLLDKNKTPIEDANLPSNRGMLITEVKGHYPINEEADDDIMHFIQFGKTDRFSSPSLNAGP